LNSYFLAMAHHQLGHSAEARQWLDRVVQASDEGLTGRPNAVRRAAASWSRRLTLELLRREAKELLGVKEK
jgi:hypothetical protein